MNKPKAIGTAGETAVVGFLRLNGFATAERRALAGAFDLGDIVGTPGLCWEVKAGAAAANAAPGQIAKWMAETLCETQNARADYGLLVTKRAAVGPARAGEWWAYLRSDDFLALSGARGPRPDMLPFCTVRITLAEAVALLRHAGYGDAPEQVAS